MQEVARMTIWSWPSRFHYFSRSNRLAQGKINIRRHDEPLRSARFTQSPAGVGVRRSIENEFKAGGFQPRRLGLDQHAVPEGYEKDAHDRGKSDKSSPDKFSND